MGFRSYGPHQIAFLEYAHQQFPDAEGFSDILSEDLRDLKVRFANQLPRGIKRSEPGIDSLVRNGFRRDESRGFSSVPARLVRPLHRRNSNDSDALSAYLSAPFRSIFLYSELDREFRELLRSEWRGLDREAGSLLHFFDYDDFHFIRFEGRKKSAVYTFSESYIRGLSPIPGANLRDIRNAGLPCLLIWSEDQSVLVPFSDVSDSQRGITERFRTVIRILDGAHFSESRIPTQQIQSLGRIESNSPIDTDVFISYHRESRPEAKEIDAYLRRQGLRVWFDDRIAPGENWSNEIWRQVSHAKATVVLWTKAAAASTYVISEAEKARTMKRLVPALLEPDVEIPVPFNTIQAFSLFPLDNRFGERLSQLATSIKAKIEPV